METKTLESRSEHRIDQNKQIQFELDHQIQKLAADILPKQPYLVTLPTDVPWRSTGRQLARWYAGTPFTEEEEQLQYLSFIPYQREYLGEEILLVSEGGWSDDYGRILEQDNQLRVEEHQSAAGTPNSSTQRKKISLNAYKNKGRGGSEEAVAEMERAQASIKKADEAMKVKTQSHVKSVMNGGAKEGSSPNRKRSHDLSQVSSQSAPHPEKKPRPTPSSAPPQKQDSRSTDKPKSPIAANTKIPKLESPTLPPMLDEITLPPLVSPTLPPDLEKIISQDPVKPLANGGLNNGPDSPMPINVSNGSELPPAPRVRIRNGDSPLVKADATGKSLRTTPVKKADGTAVKKASEDSLRVRDSGSTKQSEKVGVKNKDHVREKGHDDSPPKKKLRIILRYGKSNRKRVESLLRFAPRPKKFPSTSMASPGPANQKRELLEKEERESSQRPEKRQKLDEAEGNAIRKTATVLSAADRPRTPVTPLVPSPNIQSGALRSNFSTPKKELKSTAMRRVESMDGQPDARTPQSISRQNTPMSSERQSQQTLPPPRVSPPSSQMTSAPSASNESSETRREWRNQHNKYHDLGRKLKHDGSAVFAKHSGSSQSESKLAAALWVEALISFLVASYCLDRGSPSSAADNGWRSLLPYWDFVRGQTRQYRDLSGLVLHLGAIIRNIIHRFDIDRLARDPLPSEINNLNGSSAPTPGSDGMTKTSSSEDSERYRRRYLSFKTELVDNFRDLNSLWVDAVKRLSPQRMKEAYPSTWAKVSISIDREKEKSLSPGGPLAGEFPFPFDATTTAIEGARLGRKMLKEWCKNEGVSWTAKLEI